MAKQNNLPFENREQDAVTVSELTRRVQRTIENAFSNVCVVGEISQFTIASSGHIYLTLKDEDAVLKAIIWRSTARKLKFELEEGLELVARGSLDVYPPRGSYQLIVREVQPRGMGALQLAFRKLMKRLEEEGLFRTEHKKNLPEFPRRIGVVTSPTGAAIRDIVRVVERRWPPATIYLLPRRVQGEAAAEEIAAAIRLLNARRPDLDLMIVGRGGGSLEDLWAFNEEVVARAIFDSEIPVVSAVGHEVDTSVSDFVADARVATPSAAGENVVPDQTEVGAKVENLKNRLARSLQSKVRHARQRLDSVKRSMAFRRPEMVVQERAQRVDELWEKLRGNFEHDLAMRRERVNALAGKLEALSPLRVMDRGFSVAFDSSDEVLTSVQEVEMGDTMMTRLRDGRIYSRVETVETTGNVIADKEQQNE